MATTNVKGATGTATLDGFFKTRYGQIQKLCPTMFTLQRLMKFSAAEQIGDKYAEVALLQNEHGVTYAAPTEDAFTLSAPIAGQTKPTEVQGSQHVMRTYIGINAINSAKKRGETAFASTMDTVVSNMSDSLRKRCEIDFFYGQSANGIGVVSAYSAPAITISAATWAPGVWAGAEGALIEVWNSTITTSRGTGTVSSVDIDTRTVTLAAGVTGTSANDVILFSGQKVTTTWKTSQGLHKVSGLGTSATLWNVSTNFSLWRPSQYAVGSAQLTFAKVQKAIYKAQSKGFKGNLRMIVNPTTWADLLTDETALRRHEQGGVRQYEIGAEGIKFYTACGTVTIEGSIYCMEGYAYLLPESENKGWAFRRIGASDVGFDTIKGTSWIERVADTAAYEVRMYDNQAIYSGRPGYSVQLTGIVNAA